jgi:hypothetical protein
VPEGTVNGSGGADARPLCTCHGEAMYWNKDSRRRGGGFWRCAVKNREHCHGYYARHRQQELARARRRNPLRVRVQVGGVSIYLGHARSDAELEFSRDLIQQRKDEVSGRI